MFLCIQCACVLMWVVYQLVCGVGGSGVSPLWCWWEYVGGVGLLRLVGLGSVDGFVTGVLRDWMVVSGGVASVSLCGRCLSGWMGAVCWVRGGLVALG